MRNRRQRIELSEDEIAIGSKRQLTERSQGSYSRRRECQALAAIKNESDSAQRRARLSHQPFEPAAEKFDRLAVHLELPPLVFLKHGPRTSPERAMV